MMMMEMMKISDFNISEICRALSWSSYNFNLCNQKDFCLTP